MCTTHIQQSVAFCDSCHTQFRALEPRIYDPKSYDTLHLDCASKRGLLLEMLKTNRYTPSTFHPRPWEVL